ncbi:MAG: hypothetical protein AMJ75_03930 [Phycisphaerae bacterium SM1_79]|nr:MAG: hypothetical protein AMJ75_03930 [Phycisphaerae bacterium SM1_79]
MRITRPQHYVPYAANSFKKLVRKLGQLTVQRPIFRDPCARKQNPSVNPDFVSVLDCEGLLRFDNLQTAELYDADWLCKFLVRAREPDFSDFNQLYAVVTVELLSRLCEFAPTSQESPELVYSCEA